MVENVHDPEVVCATKVQVTAVPDEDVAVKVTVAPTVKPPMLIFGVLIFVILSLFEVPESESASRVGALGATKAPIAIVRVNAGKRLEKLTGAAGL